MDNVTYIELEGFDGTMVEYAIIDHGNEEFTSMLKATYDEQQAALSSPNAQEELRSASGNYTARPDNRADT